MSEAKHTPGPWYALDHWTDIYSPDREEPDSSPWHICRVSQAVGYQAGENVQSRANARLIAAAPDLLAACKGAVEVWEHGCVDRGWKDKPNWIDQVLDELHAAILLAEGESTNG